MSEIAHTDSLSPARIALAFYLELCWIFCFNRFFSSKLVCSLAFSLKGTYIHIHVGLALSSGIRSKYKHTRLAYVYSRTHASTYILIETFPHYYRGCIARILQRVVLQRESPKERREKRETYCSYRVIWMVPLSCPSSCSLARLSFSPSRRLNSFFFIFFFQLCSFCLFYTFIFTLARSIKWPR